MLLIVQNAQTEPRPSGSGQRQSSPGVFGERWMPLFTWNCKVGRMLARIGRWFLLAILLSGVVYLGDYLAVRFPGSRNPFGTVNVQPYYAIHLKNKKTEFD